jgi:hypothetical protein
MKNATARWRVTLLVETSGGDADTNVQSASERLAWHVEHTILFHAGMSEVPAQSPMFVCSVVADTIECTDCDEPSR